MDSQHLTSADLASSLLTEWPIQKIFYFFTGEGNKSEKVDNTAHFNFCPILCTVACTNS